MIIVRPQPVGIYAYPASNLLLPRLCNTELIETEEVPRIIDQLLRGNLDIEVPDEWRFFVAAARGDVAQALQLIDRALQQRDCDRHVQLVNAFVLRPTRAGYRECEELLRADLEDDPRAGTLLTLLHVAAFAQGVLEKFPTDIECHLDGELLAHALAASAAAQMEQEDPAAARARLQQAVSLSRESSPLLSAILLAQQAEIAQMIPGFATALVIQDLREALRLTKDCCLPLFHAELWMRLGVVLQQACSGQRGGLMEAIQAYQNALQHGIDASTTAHTFALLQNNLGLAYLSMPQVESTHQLRSGIAVQSFRYALASIDKESMPDLWASVSMNLANALQYVPTSHPQENLIQAVEIYEQVLEIRVRAKDPMAYALVLLNQANALAHLGIFKPAMEKLGEAYKLFQCHDRSEHAATAMELMEQIHQRIYEQNEQPSASHTVPAASNM